MTYTMPNEIKEIQVQQDNTWEPIIDISEGQSFEFPKDTFPEWLETFVNQVATSTQSPRDMSCMLAISVLSTSLIKKFQVQLDATWRVPVNTYCVLIADPSERKTPTSKPFFFPIYNHEREMHEMFKAERTKREAYRDSLKTQIKAKNEQLRKVTKDDDESGIHKINEQIIKLRQDLEKHPPLNKPYHTIGDITPEEFTNMLASNDETITIASSEGTFFSDFGGAYSNGKVRQEGILSAYEGDPIKVHRKKDRENGSDGLVLDRPLANVSVMVQPAVLQGIPEELKHRGLLDRFLYFKPKSLVGYRLNENEPIEKAVRDRFNKNIYKMLDMEKKNQNLILSEEARAIFKSYRDNNEEDLRDGRPLSTLKGWGGKLTGNIARIVGLLHVADHIEESRIPQVIEADTVLRAIDLTGYFINHTKASFDIVGIDEVDKVANKIVKLLKEHKSFVGKEEISMRDIKQNLTGRGRSHDDIKEQAVQVLAKNNYLKTFLNGRKKMVRINPEFFERYSTQ